MAQKQALQKTWIMVLMIVMLVMSLCPAITHAASVQLDISAGSIAITSTGYAVGGGAETPFVGEYEIIQSAPHSNDLSVLSGNITMSVTDVVVGNTVNPGIYIASGAALTLTFYGTNRFTGARAKAGIQVDPGASVVLEEGAAGAAIFATGGNAFTSGSNFFAGGAGIGGAGYTNSNPNSTATSGSITILSGTITATGGGFPTGTSSPSLGGGAGIGSGGGFPATSTDTFPQTRAYVAGPILIENGTVTATGGVAYGANCGGSAGIGGGSNTVYTTIDINGGTVVARGGNNRSTDVGGAGIGHGGINFPASEIWLQDLQDEAEITINNGMITATGAPEGAGIGGGSDTSSGIININGGTVVASGGSDAANSAFSAAGIGGGDEGYLTAAIITGGDVTAYGGSAAAGIGGGGGYYGACVYVEITGGHVRAFGGYYNGSLATHSAGGPGIGAGGAVSNANSPVFEIVISGGIVEAYGSKRACGIGSSGASSGTQSEPGSIEISGGTVTARKGETATAGFDIGIKVSSPALASIIIVGGSVNPVNYTTALSTVSPNPVNASGDLVTLYKIPISSVPAGSLVPPADVRAAVDSIMIGGIYPYGTNDVYSDAGGFIYLWLLKEFPPTITFTVTFNLNGGTGQAPLSQYDPQTVYSGWLVSRPANPTRANYNFLGWQYYNGTDYVDWDFDTDIVPGDVTLIAQWEPSGGGTDFTIAAVVTNTTGGTISPLGDVLVEVGQSQTFTITANAGYRIADVKIDGVSVGAVSSYTFFSVNSDHTIEATFLPIPSVPPHTGDTEQMWMWCGGLFIGLAGYAYGIVRKRLDK